MDTEKEYLPWTQPAEHAQKELARSRSELDPPQVRTPRHEPSSVCEVLLPILNLLLNLLASMGVRELGLRMITAIT